MKNKKLKKLKNAYLFQAQKQETQNTEPDLSLRQSPANPPASPDQPVEQTLQEKNQAQPKNTKSFAVKTPSFLFGDLKRIAWITMIATIVLVSTYFLKKNSQIFDDFGNFLYRIFHLS